MSLINTLASMFTSPQTMVVVAHIDGRIVDLSATFESRFGITREQAVGRTMRDFAFWNDANERSVVIDLLMKRGAAVRQPISHRGRDGRLFDGLASFELIECAGAKYVFTLVQDIREYDDLSEAYQRELLSFRSLFTDAEIGVYRRLSALAGYARLGGCESSIGAHAGLRRPRDADRRNQQRSIGYLSGSRTRP